MDKYVAQRTLSKEDYLVWLDDNGYDLKKHYIFYVKTNLIHSIGLPMSLVVEDLSIETLKRLYLCKWHSSNNG